MRRGELTLPDEDDQAAKYELADDLLSAAGLHWYEVSNWARTRADGSVAACRHNLAYWRGDDWWGVGPGAHSHIGGVRWWNLKFPGRYAAALASGRSPAAEREVLDAETRRMERVLLELRIADGLPLEVLTQTERGRVPALVERGLVTQTGQRLKVTLAGRLLADAVIRDLLD